MREVDAAWRVRTLSDALREASDLLGRSYLRTAAAVWDLRPLLTGEVWCRAVVLGRDRGERRVCRRRSWPGWSAFEDVQTVIAAALKLEPFDPSQGVRWSVEAAGEVEQLVERVAGGPDDRGHPGPQCPARSRSGDSSIAAPRGGCSVPDHATHAHPQRALRLGVAGPVGTGKSSLIALLCKELGQRLSVAVITNDIYTDEDARFLRSAGVLAPDRIRAVETGACPHTAIRDDVTQNLLAVEDLERDFDPVDLVLVESGGDNLTATFSPALVDAQFFVLDVAGGGDVARKGGPGIARADVLIVNKTDLGALRRRRRGPDGGRRRAGPGRSNGDRPVPQRPGLGERASRDWVLATLASFRSGALVPVDPGPMAPHSHADGTVHVH